MRPKKEVVIPASYETHIPDSEQLTQTASCRKRMKFDYKDDCVENHCTETHKTQVILECGCQSFPHSRIFSSEIPEEVFRNASSLAFGFYKPHTFHDVNVSVNVSLNEANSNRREWDVGEGEERLMISEVHCQQGRLCGTSSLARRDHIIEIVQMNDNQETATSISSPTANACSRYFRLPNSNEGLEGLMQWASKKLYQIGPSDADAEMWCHHVLAFRRGDKDLYYAIAKSAAESTSFIHGFQALIEEYLRLSKSTDGCTSIIRLSSFSLLQKHPHHSNNINESTESPTKDIECFQCRIHMRCCAEKKKSFGYLSDLHETELTAILCTLTERTHVEIGSVDRLELHKRKGRNKISTHAHRIIMSCLKPNKRCNKILVNKNNSRI